MSVKKYSCLLAVCLVSCSFAAPPESVAQGAVGNAATNTMTITQADLGKFAWSNVSLRVVSAGKLLPADARNLGKPVLDELLQLEKARIPEIDIRCGSAAETVEMLARKLKPPEQIRIWDVGHDNFLPTPDGRWLKDLRLGDACLDCSAKDVPQYAFVFAVCEKFGLQLLINPEGHMRFKRADASFGAFERHLLVSPR
jgi:hypothetical protein